MALKVGDKAPDFVLKDQSNKDVKLSDLRGRKVVLSFHPLAFTPVCAMQMKDLESSRMKFETLNAVALGLSIDSPFAKKAWAVEMGVEKTPLLSDFFPHGAVAEKFGILRPEGFSERAVFVVDEGGTIRFARVYPMKEVPDIGEILKQLEG